MAKRIEGEKNEAYRVYMSDSLALLNKCLFGGEYDYPRYLDLITKKSAQPKESAEQIKSRFDKLRRRDE